MYFVMIMAIIILYVVYMLPSMLYARCINHRRRSGFSQSRLFSKCAAYKLQAPDGIGSSCSSNLDGRGLSFVHMMLSVLWTTKRDLKAIYYF